MPELILAIAFITSILLRDMIGLATLDEPIMVTGTFLALFYLVGNYWTIKSGLKGFWPSLVVVLYGVISSSFVFTTMFHLLYFSGAFEMGVLSFIILVFVVIIDFGYIKNIGLVLVQKFKFRFLIMSVTILSLMMTPELTRIKVTYRNYPEFIEFYIKNKTPFYSTDYMVRDYFEER